MATGHAIGGFAEGFVRGADSASERAYRAKLRKKQALENEQTERDAQLDTEIGEFSTNYTGYQQAEAPQALQGPTQDGQPLTTETAHNKIQSLMARAQLSKNPGAKDAAARIAAMMITPDLLAADRAQAPEEKAAALNSASQKLLGRDIASVGDDGVLTALGQRLETPEAIQGLNQYMVNLVQNPADAMEKYGMWGITMNQESRADSLAESKISVDASRIKVDASRIKVDAALIKYYNDRANLANAEASAAGLTPIWANEEEKAKAIDRVQEQVEGRVANNDQFFSDEYAESIGLPDGQTLQAMTTTFAGLAVAEHGNTALATAVPGSQKAIAFLAGDTADGDPIIDIVQKNGSLGWFAQTNSGASYALSSEQADQVARKIAQQKSQPPQQGSASSNAYSPGFLDYMTGAANDPISTAKSAAGAIANTPPFNAFGKTVEGVKAAGEGIKGLYELYQQLMPPSEPPKAIEGR